ncbi:hypothetical protein FLGE108171_15480 [Flavobacterium gelidilacus]|uniref:hypothetical protein n=1 Tax=Flavobacterium gelidilacus TaxID=206041 RepID=UPI0003FF207B|nr:hypothetical protein [Flavobacterium gelidilacus]
MLTFEEKIDYLKKNLNRIENNFADEVRSEILFFFDEFEIKNEQLDFLKTLNLSQDIDVWVEKLTSRIILKFDFESEQINDFIYDFIENGK